MNTIKGKFEKGEHKGVNDWKSEKGNYQGGNIGPRRYEKGTCYRISLVVITSILTLSLIFQKNCCRKNN